MGLGVGISFGKGRARLLALRLHGHKGTVVNCAEQILTEQNDALADPAQLNGTWHKLLAGRVAVGLPPSETTTRIFSLPFRRKEQIARTIQFETENLVEAYRQEDSVLSYRRLASSAQAAGSPQSLMLAVSGRRAAVRNSIEALKPLNAKPTTIDTDLTAVYNLVCFLDALPAKGGGVTVCDGGEWAYMFFVVDGQLLKARRLRVPQDEARGEGFARLVAQDIARTCAEMQIDPANCEGRAVGTAFRDTEATETLARTTGIAFGAVDIAERIEMPAEMRDGGWEVALGLAMRAAGEDRSQVNLRAEEFALQGKSVALMSCAALFLAAVLAMLVVWQINASADLSKAEERLTAIQEEQKKIHDAILPGTKYHEARFAEDIDRVIKNGGNYAEDMAIPSSRFIVRALEEAIEALKPDVAFEIDDKWDYDRGNGYGENAKAYGLRVTIKILKGTQEDARKLTEEIKSKNPMLAADIDKSTANVSFDLVIAFKGGEKE